MFGVKDFPHITESEKTPIVTRLLEIVQEQNDMMQKMRDEIAHLKGQKTKPNIKPSQLDKKTDGKSTKNSANGKRPGSAKRVKTATLPIHSTQVIRPEVVPDGAEFKGYSDWVVQDLQINTTNTLFRMERWRLPDGTYIQGNLPSDVEGHFGVTLKSYILYQYHQCHVTQPLLLEQLREFGVDISAGQLNWILTEENDAFHEEKDEILETGLEVSSYVQVDDTGARHDGKNGYCTHIGNDFFTWFRSTESKTRLNFVELLGAGKIGYLVNDDALDYMKKFGIKRTSLLLDLPYVSKSFSSTSDWQTHLLSLGIKNKRSVSIATEAVLLAYFLSEGLNRDLIILSDDAGQFDLLSHALCWVHAERLIHKLIPMNNAHRKAQDLCRDQIWRLYRKLKAYKLKPTSRRKIKIEQTFDYIFTQKTGYPELNGCLARLYENKVELLLVLDHPQIPLHNNGSETDIREYVKRRKISGGTRSDPGRKSRDTFTSLKKTCRKLRVSFWKFLNDRVGGRNAIPTLSELIQAMANDLQPLAFTSSY